MPYDTLTTRETEILRCIVQGKSNHQIAAELTISEVTVHNHVASILAKLMLENRTQAAVHALRFGLVSIDVVPLDACELN